MSAYQKLDTYIQSMREKMSFHQPEDKGLTIGLPNEFIAPTAASGIFSGDQFYRDSFFIMLGLVHHGKAELAKGMIDNFLYLYERFQIIPSRNRFYNVGISQIPLLSSMIELVSEHFHNPTWKQSAYTIAECELNEYRMDGRKTPETHCIYAGLSRYCDHNIVHVTAEHESGRDMTSRFDDRCLDILPVDLNAALYMYEKNIAHHYESIGANSLADRYHQQAQTRKQTMTKLMRNVKEGFFYDFDFRREKPIQFKSLAAYRTLRAGLATKEQAAQLVQNIETFKCPGGLANTQSEHLHDTYKQRDYPNGRACQQRIVVTGLENYGYHDLAKKIAMNRTSMVADILEKDGIIYEKYDVTTMTHGKEGRYANQTGFGRTNGVTSDFLYRYELI